jgi:hypothetical protein
MIRAVLGLLPSIIIGLILLAINPLLGVLWILWISGVGVFAWKKK